MQASLMRSCEQFIENRKRVERVFLLSTPQQHCMCALLLCLDDCDADLAAIRRGLHTLRRRTPVFSTFRGVGITPIATKLSMRDRDDQWINYAKDNLRALKKAGFAPTDYLCLAAMLMIKRHDKAEAVAARAREIYASMRHAHRILTASEDVCFAVLGAMYEDEPYAAAAAETAFETLKGSFGAVNPVLTAANELALLSVDPKQAALDTAWLYARIRALGVRTKTKSELGMLALIAALCGQDEQAAKDVAETEQYLARQRGFSAVKLGRAQRLMCAASLVAIDRLHAAKDDKAYAKRRDTLQCALIVDFTLSVVQGMAATGI